jgi:hypothetical protein
MHNKNLFLFISGIFVPPFLLMNANIEVLNFLDVKNIFYLNFSIIVFCSAIYILLFKLFRINILNYFLFILFSNFFIKKFILLSLITFNIFIILNLFLTFLYIILAKKINFPEKLSNFLLVTFTIFIIYSLTNYFLNQTKKEIKENVFYDNTFENLILKNKPDIIHIIPDSLLSIDELEKAGYDVEKMKKNFESMNLEIIKNSYANYTKTHFSVASFLNGSIFKENYEWKEADIYKYMNNSTFHQKLIENGYQIEWYETRWLGSRCPQKAKIICANKNFLQNEFFVSLSTSLNINYMWFEKFYFKIFKKSFSRHLEVVLNNIDKHDTTDPRYIYGYMQLPHPPFTVNKNCESSYIFFSTSGVEQPIFNKSQYLEQVSCLEKSLKRLYSSFKERGRDFVIIIQSDTGHFLYGYDKYPSPSNDLDYPIEVFKPMFAVSKSLKCFEDKNKIFNVELLNLILSCINNEIPKKISNKDQLYSIYHHDHKKYGRIHKYSTPN